MRIHRSIVAPSVLALALGLTAGDAGAQTLRGSRGSVERMYDQARDHDLTFFRSGKGVRSAASQGDLVRLSGNSDYRLHQVTYPYALPTTRTFIQRLASQYRDACGERMVVTSAVRPTSYRLFNSVDKSVHPTGMGVDIRKPTKGSCLRFLRETLLYLENRGAVEATEEHRPPHFHVAVFPRQYLAHIGRKPGERLAQSTPKRTSSSTRSSSRSSAQRTTYRVRRGDTLWTIARRHGTSVDRLKEANDIRTSNLAVGKLLVIPGGR
ncbi:MAG TPA: DUF5715 family protein [Longimicrobium sp.]|nr:DUF5715 family protein [Longimicrobium sp.]